MQGQLAAGLTSKVRQAMEAAAASALLPRFRKLAEHEIEEKEAGEVVTVADRECEALLGEALARLLPEASLVGEEAVHADPRLAERLGDELCWVIDPLDGTAYFAGGTQPFGVMVALASRGTAVGGWILDPLGGRFCWAAAGQGSWINEHRIAAPLVEAGATVGLSPLLRRRAERIEAVTQRLQGHFVLSDIPRCAAAQYPAMLLGAPALTLYERTLPWDHAAGALLIEEAGGRVARLDGSPYLLNDHRVGLLAANSPALWEQAAALLADLLE
jgi:fructose-1,6-bisphosphatase/inositol monophosphatase family enzyme